MEQGLYSAVKSKWDEIKENPNRTFTADEISKIKQTALEIKNNKQK